MTDNRAKYTMCIRGEEFDVYDLIVALGITCPAQQHAFKKMCKLGKRGVKDVKQDLRETIEALERAIELQP